MSFQKLKELRFAEQYRQDIIDIAEYCRAKQKEYLKGGCEVSGTSLLMQLVQDGLPLSISLTLYPIVGDPDQPYELKFVGSTCTCTEEPMWTVGGRCVTCNKIPPKTNEKFWAEEIEKCKNSPWYFATTYTTVNGKPFKPLMSEEQFNKFYNSFLTNHEGEF